MTKRSTDNPLPTPPPGWTWQTAQDDTVSSKGQPQTTFQFTLHDTTGQPRGRGRIAVELYGWDAVTSRATTLIREATK